MTFFFCAGFVQKQPGQLCHGPKRDWRLAAAQRRLSKQSGAKWMALWMFLTCFPYFDWSKWVMLHVFFHFQCTDVTSYPGLWAVDQLTLLICCSGRIPMHLKPSWINEIGKNVSCHFLKVWFQGGFNLRWKFTNLLTNLAPTGGLVDLRTLIFSVVSRWNTHEPSSSPWCQAASGRENTWNTERDGKEGAKPQLTCFGWMIFAWGVWKFKCIRISSWCQNSECSNWIQLDFRFDKPGFSVGCCCWTVIRSQQGLRLFICRVFLCQVSFPINRGTKKRFCVMHDKLLRSCKVLTWMMSRSYGALGVKSNQGNQIPCSVYGGWLKLMVSVGKYSIYGVYGHYFLLVSFFSTNGPDFFPTRLTTVALFPGGICFLCW